MVAGALGEGPRAQGGGRKRVTRPSSALPAPSSRRTKAVGREAREGWRGRGSVSGTRD